MWLADAQSDARWEDMPHNAVATDKIDVLMSAAEIAKGIVGLPLLRQSRDQTA
jgi:hypothetical protein